MSPNVHAISDAASAAFSKLVACPAQGCDDGQLLGGTCETCGGTGRVMPSPEHLAACAIERRVSATLERDHVHGGFSPIYHGPTTQLSWNGARNHRDEAETALVDALRSAGLTASAIPGWGVRVMREEVARAA